MIQQTMTEKQDPPPVSTSWPPYVDEHDCNGWNWPDEVELDPDGAEQDALIADQEWIRTGA